MFTRQHYVKLATLVGGLSCEGERMRLASGMADMLEKDNPLFRRSMFYAACKVPLPAPPKKYRSNKG